MQVSVSGAVGPQSCFPPVHWEKSQSPLATVPGAHTRTHWEPAVQLAVQLTSGGQVIVQLELPLQVA